MKKIIRSFIVFLIVLSTFQSFVNYSVKNKITSYSNKISAGELESSENLVGDETPQEDEKIEVFDKSSLTRGRDIVTLPSTPKIPEVINTGMNSIDVSTEAQFNTAYKNPKYNFINITKDLNFGVNGKVNLTGELTLVNRSLTINGNNRNIYVAPSLNSKAFVLSDSGAGKLFKLKNMTITTPYLGPGLETTTARTFELVTSPSGKATNWSISFDGVTQKGDRNYRVYAARTVSASEANVFFEGIGHIDESYYLSTAKNLIFAKDSNWSFKSVYHSQIRGVFKFNETSLAIDDRNVYINGNVDFGGEFGYGVGGPIEKFLNIYISGTGKLSITDKYTQGIVAMALNVSGKKDVKILVDNFGELKLKSEYGFALYNSLENDAILEFKADSGSKIEMIANSYISQTYSGVIASPVPGASFIFNSPESFDLVNYAPTMSTDPIIDSADSTYKFEIYSSDINTWDIDINPDGPPNSPTNWTNLTLLSNQTKRALEGSSSVLTSEWKTSKYRRISGKKIASETTFEFIDVHNNDKPVDSYTDSSGNIVNTPYSYSDADKNFAVQAYFNYTSVDEANWVEVIVSAIYPDNTTKIISQGVTDANGIYRFSTNDFFKSGTILSVTGKRVGMYPVILEEVAYIYDATPPVPVTVSPTAFSAETKSFKGVTEPMATIKAKNITTNKMLKDNLNNDAVAIADENGNYNFSFSSLIAKNDQIQIFATDTPGNQKNGVLNTSPATDFVFHEAIFLKSTVVDVSNDIYTIFANNFTTGKTQIAALIANDAELIKLSAAKSTMVGNSAKMGTILVDSVTINPNNTKEYSLVMSVKESPDKKITVKITVSNYDIITEGINYIIGVNNYDLTLLEIPMVEDDSHVIKSEAKAWLKSNPLVFGTVLLQSSTVEEIVGKYMSIFSVKEETTTRAVANVMVVDYDEIAKGVTYTIGANNFVTGKTQIDALITDNAALIAKSKVKSWLNSTKIDAGTIQVDSVTVNPNNNSEYTLVMSVVEEEGTKISVKIKVANFDVITEGDAYIVDENNVNLAF